MILLPQLHIKLIPIFAVLLATTWEESVKTTINPSQQQLTIMDAGQYHFVPLGSFFQYSLASWQKGGDSKYIDKVTVNYNIQILSENPQYNFIVLYTDNNDTQPYSLFNCYVRAVNQGLSELMQNCNFPSNFMSNGTFHLTQGVCNTSIEASATTLFTSSSTFFNCTDTIINYSIKSNTDGTTGPINGTLLFLIDNSGLFSNISPPPTNMINLILTHEVIANVNEQEKAKLYLFSGLTGILILIMIIIAVVLNCKIRKLDKELQGNERIKVD